jgi:hypothetical protein
MTRARSLSLLANSNVFTVDQSNSRVGIGSTIPDVKLDVDGDMNVTGTLTYEDVTNVETAGITTTGGLVVTGLGATIGGITTFFGDINFGAAGVGGTVTTLGHGGFTGIVTALGFQATGVVTAASFRGDGSQLSGVDSSNLIDSGDTNRVAANTSGIVVTGLGTINGSLHVNPNTAGKQTFNLTTNASNDARLLMKSDTTTKVDIQANGDTFFDGGDVSIGSQSPLDGAELTVAGKGIAITGQNTAHSANSMRLGEEGSGLAQIRCYGPDASTNGSLTLRSSRSDGTNSQDVTLESTGRLRIGSDSDYSTSTGSKLSVELMTTAGTILEVADQTDGFSTLESVKNAGGGASDYGGYILRGRRDADDDAKEYLRITSDGNVGINETSPNTQLVVKGASNSTTNSVGNINVISSDSAAIDLGGSIGLGGFYNGTSNSIPFANLHGKKENGTNNNALGYFAISTRDASGTSEKFRITSGGDVLPGGDNSQDLGSTSKRWANIYSADLQLSNEGMGNDVDGTWGKYTIQEGENDLFLLNRRNGKKYRFMLEEV